MGVKGLNVVLRGVKERRAPLFADVLLKAKFSKWNVSGTWLITTACSLARNITSHIPTVMKNSSPLGRWVLKYRSFFFSPSRMCILIGLLDFREHVMWANSTARCRRWFVAEFIQVHIVFIGVAIFAKTECYSPSNLLVCSATYRTSARHQLLTCRKWYVAFQAFHDHFSHETYEHHATGGRGHTSEFTTVNLSNYSQVVLPWLKGKEYQMTYF